MTTETPLTRELRHAIAGLTDMQLKDLGLYRLIDDVEPPGGIKLSVFPEIAAAAKWWADQLRMPPFMDNGDAYQSILGSTTAVTLPPLQENQIGRFERWLAWLCQTNFSKNWNPSEPDWARGCRTLATDYGPDLTLHFAAKRAGIIGDLMLRFPWKTVMWISPGSVKLRCGYGAQELELFKAAGTDRRRG
jgi:hypothetical protein